MSRAHRPGRTFYSLPAREPEPLWNWYVPQTFSIDWSAPESDRFVAFARYYRRLCEEDLIRQLLAPAYPPTPEAALPRNFGTVDGPNAALEADTVKTLVDLARAGDEATFRDLALCSGVPAKELDELWRGTTARLAPATEGSAP